MYFLRKATYDDLDEMFRIASEGKKILKERGIDQWQGATYPSREQFTADIENGISYVFTDDDKPIAICTISYDGEPSYDYIEGEWLTGASKDYATVHRCAIAPEYRGKHLTAPWFGSFIAQAKLDGAGSVRIDTHHDNKIMQRSLENAGFTPCGTIYLADGESKGAARIGYEIVFTKE